MKKSIVLILLLLSIGVQAQIPDRWFTQRKHISFNPYTASPITKDETCLVEFDWADDVLTVNDCEDNTFKFTPTTTWEKDIPGEYYHCRMYEQKSGNTWFILFYYKTLMTSMLTDDGSFLVIHYIP